MTKEPTAYRRYRDLLEYFGNDLILEDDEEFKKWLERIKWHVRKADELYQKYERQKEHCKDSISREDVIKAIDRHTFDTDDGLCLDEDISIILEGLPLATPTQNWISVSERLPEKDVEVLATTEWGEVTIAMYCVTDWLIHEGDTNAETDEIVAWMPLPKPYKTEMESEE